MLLFCFTSTSIADITSYFNQIKHNPKALHAFFNTMPKGGELHYHLSGGASTETLIHLAAAGSYCVDESLTLIPKAQACPGIASPKLLEPSWYGKTLRAWSLKDFLPLQESASDHFFKSFAKFKWVALDHSPNLLAEVMQHAANQHELYLEILLQPDQAKSIQFADLIHNQRTLEEKYTALVADKRFLHNVQYTVQETHRIYHKARALVGCDIAPQKPACTLKVTFQYYAQREKPVDQVFTQALTGFLAASRSNLLVGVNIVQAEHGRLALQDYHQHMQLFQFLHHNFPKVHISLHAGELTPDIAPPKDLRLHIHEALLQGNAERIGHGIAIQYEDQKAATVAFMATHRIPVETCLTSNQTLFHVSGSNHPLNFYLQHGVPIVLSTDDEGILRTDLSQQFFEAVVQHHLDYPTLKTINRNTLTYSFLPGKSLWQNPQAGIPVPACQKLTWASCLKFIQGNDKGKLQWELEQQLYAFEKKYAHSV